MLILSGEHQVRAYRESLAQGGLEDLHPWVFRMWVDVLQGIHGAAPLGWISPGVFGLVIASLFGRAVTTGKCPPDPVLSDWVARIRGSAPLRVVFNRFDWLERDQSVANLLVPFLNRLHISLALGPALNWGYPEADLQMEKGGRESEATEAGVLVRDALRKDLLFPLQQDNGLAAVLRYPEILRTQEEETMAASWISVADQVLAAVDNVAFARPLDTQERYQDEFLLAAGGYDDIEPRGPGKWDALLPSELAFIEDEYQPDLFDLKVIQNGLLHFVEQQEEQRRTRRRITLILDLKPGMEQEALLGWYMAWWEVLVTVLRRRCEGDVLTFQLIREGAVPSRWKTAAQLLVRRLQSLGRYGETEVHITDEPGDLPSVPVEQWHISVSGGKGAPGRKHRDYDRVVTLEEPSMETIRRIRYEKSVVRRYTRALYQCLDIIERGEHAR